jgi:hypothetical protein
MSLYPEVQPGDLVVYQTREDGLEQAVNARVQRAFSGGFVDLLYFPEGVDARTPQRAEMTESVAGVPYAPDGRQQTWHLTEEL